MFDKFCDYMYYLLISPFKRVKKSINQWYILFRVLGKRFDDALESLYAAEEQTMLATCESEMLPVHAEDRKMTQYPGEDAENFRTRIANYPEVIRLGGSDPGVLLAVRTLGYDNPELIKANTFKGCTDRWAEFYVVINMGVDDVHPIGIDVLKKEVRKTKQVGAKGFSDFQTTIYGYYKLEYLCWLDGGWLLDGSVNLGACKKYEEEISVSEVIKTRCYAKKEVLSRITGTISPVKYIALGTGAGPYGQEKNHLAEDRNLFHEVIRKEIKDIVSLDDLTYKFSITLDHEEAVGERFNEIMLVDEDGDAVLFSSFLTKTKVRAEETYTIVLS